MPKGYIYAELEVTDPALFETYRPLAAASIAEFGGRYAVRGGDPKVLEGGGPPPRSVTAGIRRPRAGDGMVQLAAISSRVADQAAVGHDQSGVVDRAKRRVISADPPPIGVVIDPAQYGVR